jgi:hypothetical protein
MTYNVSGATPGGQVSGINRNRCPLSIGIGVQNHWTAHLRIHGTTARRPAEVFAAEEMALLAPEPAEPYDVPIFAEPKVARDYHIEVSRALYSVPCAYIGQRVQVRADSALVRVYHRGSLIKTWG